MKKTVQTLKLRRETLHNLMLGNVVGNNATINLACSRAGVCTVTCAGAKCTGAVCN